MPPYYGTSVAPASTLTDPGLTRLTRARGACAIQRRVFFPPWAGTRPLRPVQCGSLHARVRHWLLGFFFLHHAGSLGGCILYANLYRVSIYCNCNGWLASLPRLGPAFRRLLSQSQKKADRMTGANSHDVWPNDCSLLFQYIFLWQGNVAKPLCTSERMTRRRRGTGKILKIARRRSPQSFGPHDSPRRQACQDSSTMAPYNDRKQHTLVVSHPVTTICHPGPRFPRALVVGIVITSNCSIIYLIIHNQHGPRALCAYPLQARPPTPTQRGVDTFWGDEMR